MLHEYTYVYSLTGHRQYPLGVPRGEGWSAMVSNNLYFTYPLLFSYLEKEIQFHCFCHTINGIIICLAYAVIPTHNQWIIHRLLMKMKRNENNQCIVLNSRLLIYCSTPCHMWYNSVHLTIYLLTLYYISSVTHAIVMSYVYLWKFNKIHLTKKKFCCNQLPSNVT